MYFVENLEVLLRKNGFAIQNNVNVSRFKSAFVAALSRAEPSKGGYFSYVLALFEEQPNFLDRISPAFFSYVTQLDLPKTAEFFSNISSFLAVPIFVGDVENYGEIFRNYSGIKRFPWRSPSRAKMREHFSSVRSHYMRFEMPVLIDVNRRQLAYPSAYRVAPSIDAVFHGSWVKQLEDWLLTDVEPCY